MISVLHQKCRSKGVVVAMDMDICAVLVDDKTYIKVHTHVCTLLDEDSKINQGDNSYLERALQQS